MSESLASLRSHLNGARQLGSVVRAMKAISASSINQYEKAVEALGQYRRAVELGLSLCLSEQRPAARVKPTAGDHRIGALVFGSDQGLVGRFNEIIGDFAGAALQKLPGPKTVWAAGERLAPALEATGLNVAKAFKIPSSVTGITGFVTEIQIELEKYQADGLHSEIHVFHNSPRAAAGYTASSQRLLPLDADWFARLRAIPWPSHRSAQVLGVTSTSLAALVREQLFISLYQACAESLASENVSRLEAMQRAEQNIESMTDALQRSLNRLRQSSIDEELFDVVAGSNALSSTPTR
jgi:F-type H+-transporting ATPase subunit gamma